MTTQSVIAVMAAMVIFLIGLLVAVFHFKKSKYLLGLSVFVFLGSYVLYSVTKSSKDFVNSEANIVTTVDAIYGEFNADEVAAGNKFVINNLVVQVNGFLKDVVVDADSTTTIILVGTDNPDATVSIALEIKNPELAKGLVVGGQLSVKGQCTGMLDDFVTKKVQMIRGGVVN